MSFLGIDIGTSGVKAIVIDEKGGLLAQAISPLSVSTPKPLYVTQSPSDWWNACVDAVRKACVKDSIAKNVRAIGLSGQMVGTVLLDERDSLLMDSMIWQDQRSVKQVEAMKAKIGMETLIRHTMNVPLTGYTASKLLWLQENLPDIFTKTRTVLFPKDYIRFKLTGEKALDVSDTAGTYLMDIQRRDFSEDIFRMLELDRNIFPERIYESHEVAGVLVRSAAEAMGLNEGIPCVAGAGDQMANAVGTGAVREGIATVSIGTSGAVFCTTDKPHPDEDEMVIIAGCHAVKGKWDVLGCTLSAGGAYEWLKDHFAFRETAQAEKLETSPYDLMNAAAQSIPCGAEGLFFLPYLNGERSPYPDPNARGVFFGLSLRHGWPHMVRSVIEGILFSLRDILEAMRAKGIVIEQIRLSGGSAKSAFWRQLSADVFGSEIVTINHEEGPSVGAAVLAAVGSGYFSSAHEACDAWIRLSSPIYPRAEERKRYDELYAFYHGMYDRMKDMYGEHAKLL